MNIAIIGAGPSGLLMAISLAKKGHNITIYEYRKDFRKNNVYNGRSINLALSYRGIKALNHFCKDSNILKYGVNLDSRYIHPLVGPEYKQPYGLNNESIISINRQVINEKILIESEKYPNIKVIFEAECQYVDVHKKIIIINNKVKKHDLVIGADGVNSKVRQGILAQSNISFKRNVIDHSYKELYIAPNDDGSPKLNTSSLHIWPRGDFMMIALPNTDNSFTVTLFMPTNIFKNIKTNYDIQTFFETYFPNTLPILHNLYSTFNTNPISQLNIIHLNPWHYKDYAIVIGDAAHAMVPFYGQGLNCSLEDVFVLDSLIDESFNKKIENVFENYSKNRSINTNAIQQLSQDNYLEMRSTVMSKSYRLKTYIENLIYKNPFLQEQLNLEFDFIPKYTMVAFSDIPYAEVVKRDIIQKQKLNNTIYKIILYIVLFTSGAFFIKPRL